MTAVKMSDRDAFQLLLQETTSVPDKTPATSPAALVYSSVWLNASVPMEEKRVDARKYE